MKPFLMFALGCFLAVAPGLRAQTESPDDQYFTIYSLILRGDRLTEKGKIEAAKTNYIEAEKELKAFQEDFPLWNSKLVKYRIGYLDAKLAPPEPAPAMPVQRSSRPAPEAMATPADSGAPVELKLKWPVGKRYDQQFKAAVNATVNMPGQNQQSRQEVGLTQGFAISVMKERDGGGRELQIELTGTKVSVKSGGMVVMSLDSDQPQPTDAANPAAAVISRLSSIKLTLMMDANGKPESIEGLEDAVKALVGPNAAAQAQIMKQLPMVNDSFKNMAGNSSGLPDKPVKVGDTWNKNMDINAGTTDVAENFDYTFTGWEEHDGHHCAVIHSTGDISPNNGPNDPTTTTIHVDGTLWFDPEMGMAVDNAMKLSMEMKVKMGNQAMTTKVAGDLGVKLTKVSDIAL